MRLVYLTIIALATSSARVRAEGPDSQEIADRAGLESVWNRSGRTTRVIDYPFSPRPWVYSGPDLREWGNQGYIFINPRIREKARPLPAPTPAEELTAAGTLEAEEIARMLEEEKARRLALESEIKAAREELAAAQAQDEDQAAKILILEKQIEDLESAQGAAAAGGTGAEGAAAAAGPSLEKMDSYPVGKDQSLWSIAGRPEVYGNPYKWLLLYHANRDQIFDPDLIYPGMILLVPRYKDLEVFPPPPAEGAAVSAAGGEAAAPSPVAPGAQTAEEPSAPPEAAPPAPEAPLPSPAALP